MNTETTTPETSCRLFAIVEDGEYFEPETTVNGIKGMYLSFEQFSDTDDGTFPRVSDYVRLINRMEHEGTGAFLTWIGKSKLKFDSGYCKVIRESKYGSEATLLFDKPITVVAAYVNDTPVTFQANKITGEFTHEWYWNKNGRQDKYCNSVEVYFDCKKFELI
jgi:hypothetical protein